MRVLIICGTAEGHTRKIATEVERQLRDGGHDCVAVDADHLSRELEVMSFDALVGRTNFLTPRG